MHLSELLGLRTVPAAGLAMGITRRCPLSCAHCSTNSTIRSEEMPEEVFHRFVGTFTVDVRPDVLALSGGEAMLRPGLVFDLATRARAVGCRVTALSGLFFATSHRIPRDIHRAIMALDHFSVSIDAFHEREVPRDRVFAVLAALLADGVDLSIHTLDATGDGQYVDGLVGDLTEHFGQRIPMFVNALGFFGRARDWLAHDAVGATAAADIDPCAMAAWPVMGFDGTIVACGNDDALDALPDHLRLGHAAVDDWATIRRRTVESAMMRAIRTIGPLAIAHGAGRAGCDGYCGTCLSLSRDAAARRFVEREAERPVVAVMEHQMQVLQQRAGATGFARRNGVPHYAGLTERGLAS